LRPPALSGAGKQQPLRLYLDAGHGAPGNKGASSVLCEDEQEHTLRVAEYLAAYLTRTGAFRVQLSRSRHNQAPYAARLEAARAFSADAIVSLHADARGTARPWVTPDRRDCLRNDATPGFSLLWSDDADSPLLERRRTLATALARRMRQTGFLPYDGADYVGLYDPTPAEPGVFVDRHLPGFRILFLRAPRLPSVIIETHHALDLAEVTRWREPKTLEAFAAAVAAGLLDALRP
jgi:N-acetylmuramoyl-L-alanine amidase